MKNKIENIDAKRVTLDAGFIILIVRTENIFDFILTREGYGVYEHMFGICADETTTDDYLLDLALANYPDYIGDYIRSCMD